MSSDLCKNCGKPPLAGRAGSVTSYFFQHNYCQCSNNKVATAKAKKEIAQTNESSPVCANCGKSKPDNKRAGSFTSFLFQELRCSCSGSSSKQSSQQLQRHSSRAGSQTAARIAQKKQFTEGLRKNTAAAVEGEQLILAKGTMIGGNYRVISQIGQGGMSVVYLVEQTALGKQFALKVLAPELVNEHNWQRFKAEAKTMASLQHSSFVNVYDLGIHAGTMPFYSMEFISGRSLEEILAEEGPLQLEAALNIFIEALNGLAYAHRNGIIHRDIKPANIMLSTANGITAVKILDFGISKLISSDDAKHQSMTMVGDIFGSPFYMSPEQCAGEATDARSDIYSIGCSLFETLTACIPFSGSNSLEIMLKHQEDAAPLLNDIAPNQAFPLTLEAVVATCLAKLPRDRYQSAKELVLDLEKIKSGQELQATSPAFRTWNSLLDTYENDDNDTSQKTSSTLTKVIILSTATLMLLAVAYAAINFYGGSKIDTFTTSTGSDSYELAPATTADNDKTKSRYYSKLTDDGNTIQFDFPSDYSIGAIGTIEKLHKHKKAQSIVTFPANTELIFSPDHYAFVHPEVFDSFRPTDLTSLKTPTEQSTPLYLKQVLPHIAKLTGLKNLTFFGTKLNDEGLAQINKLPNLERLNIDATEVTPAALSKLARLPKLRALHYGSCPNAGHSAILKALEGSTSLETLAIDSLETPLSEADAKLISTCKNLKFLGLQASVSSDKVLEILSTLPNLESIDLQFCVVSKEAVEKFKKAYLPRKIKVDFQGHLGSIGPGSAKSSTNLTTENLNLKEPEGQ